MSNNTVNMTIRIDKDFKEEMDHLFKEFGISTSAAIMMFLKQCERERAIPFTPSIEPQKPTKELKKALKELDDIESGKTKVKGYHDVNKFIKDMLD